MAYFEGVFGSDIMEMDTNLCAIIPDGSIRTGTKARVLYLLHGYGGNHKSWMRSSNIELLANRYGLAVIMPDAGYAYYQDMALGKPYFTYITEELPRFAGNLFPVSTKREDSYVIGNSMGGYGALKCVLSRPDRYAAGAGLCAVPDIHWALDPVLFNFNPKDGPLAGYQQRLNEAISIYGTDPKITDEQDLYLLAEKAAASRHSPRILSVCGRSDGLLKENERLASHLKTLNLDFSFETIEGKHDGEFSQRALELALKMIFESEK